jgi:hypothetical protein
METRSARTIGMAAGLIGAAALLAGCGGDGKGGVLASCGKVAPCGGSLVGTWTVSSSCDSPTNFTGGAACPAATIDESQVKVTGLLTFGADMTFATSIAQSGTLRFSVPVDCVASIGAGSCDELASLISPGPPDATTTCTTTNATCVCALVYAGSLATNSNGTYTTAGSVLTTTDDAGYTADSSYCVQGNAIHVVSVDATTGAITSDLVATK